MTTSQRNQRWINDITQVAREAARATRASAFNEDFFIRQDAFETQTRNIERVVFPASQSPWV